MKTTAAVTRSAAGTRSAIGVDSQVYTAGLTTFGLAACAVGLWAAAGLISGMIAGGGPIGLAAAWFKAVFGM